MPAPPAALSLRDPIHGFIRADPLEAALIDSRPLQRLRWVRQLGLAHRVFHGAEHTRFGHALGAMELAGHLYDALASRPDSPLEPGPRALGRRRVRAAALLHDIGHAPFSHSTEGRFEEGLSHEEMTLRLLHTPELEALFEEHGGEGPGEGVSTADLERILRGDLHGPDALLGQIVAGELDADKMDYLLRDSHYCGVRYGNYDLARLLDTVIPVEDPETGAWSLGVDEGGIHALEALVLARYYMFVQVYFNVISKVLELHLGRFLEDEGWRWPIDPEAFLEIDDVTVTAALRASSHPHAEAIVQRRRFTLAYESDESLAAAEREHLTTLLPRLRERFGDDRILASHAAKDPHRLDRVPVPVRRWDGRLEPLEEASQFLGHLTRIERWRIYTAPELRKEVAAAIRGG